MNTPVTTNSTRNARERSRLWLIAAGALVAAIGLGASQGVAGASTCGCTVNDPPITYQRSVADSGGADVFRMAANGSGQVRLTNSPGFDGMPSWSPNRSRIAFVSGRASVGDSLNFELFVMDGNGANVRRLTNHPAFDSEPAWSPVSDKIAFTTNRDGNAEIYVVNADGTGLRRLTNTTTGEKQAHWSPDGTKIVFVSDRGGAGTANLFVMNADGTGVRRLTNFTGFDENPQWSHDGKTIAFNRDLSGNVEVHTVNANGGTSIQFPAVVRRVTNRPGFDGDPTWSPDGRIGYVSATSGAPGDIRVTRPDGTGDIALTNTTDREATPDWGRVSQPVLSQ